MTEDTWRNKEDGGGLSTYIFDFLTLRVLERGLEVISDGNPKHEREKGQRLGVFI